MCRTTVLTMGTTAVVLAFFACLVGCEDNYVVEERGGDGGEGGQAPSGGSGGTGGTGGTGGDMDAGGAGGGMDAGGADGDMDAGRDTGVEDDEDAGDDGEPPSPPAESVDRSHLSDVGMTESLDYSDPALWVCHPEHEYNFCQHNIDATEMLSDGTRQLVERERAENPEFDCFYVYPTVLLNGDAQQTDFSDISIVHDPIMSQAAPFTTVCKMYAPLYRQTGLSGGLPVAGSDRALALQDVRDAFAYYLEHLNQGRNFVLMGHSQGTMMLTSMMQADVDDNPDVLSKMISALLLGGTVTVPQGEVVGGTFENIPICSAQGETGCVVHYVSFAADAPPDSSARFGFSSQEGVEIACANPALLAGNTSWLQGSYLRSSVRNPVFSPDDPIPEGIDTPFLLYREMFRAECVKGDNTSYLAISVDPAEGDQRENPPYRSSYIESIGFGLHLVDYNLPIGDLIEMVKQQAAAMP